MASCVAVTGTPVRSPSPPRQPLPLTPPTLLSALLPLPPPLHPTPVAASGPPRMLFPLSGLFLPHHLFPPNLLLTLQGLLSTPRPPPSPGLSLQSPPLGRGHVSVCLSGQ